MFRVNGILLVSATAFYFVFRSTISDYITMGFLKDSLDVMEYMLINIKTSKMYKQTIQESNVNRYKYYRPENHNVFFENIKDNIFIDKYVLKKVSDFFKNAGTHNMKEEIEYITNYIAVVKNDYRCIQERYSNNLRVNLVSAISASLIVLIFLL